MNDTHKEDYIQALSDIDCAQEYLKKVISQAIELFRNYVDMPQFKARSTLASLHETLCDTQHSLNNLYDLNHMSEAIKEVQNNYNLVDMIEETQRRFDMFANMYDWVYMELKDNDYEDNENFKALREALCTVGDLINDDCETWGIAEEEKE